MDTSVCAGEEGQDLQCLNKCNLLVKRGLGKVRQREAPVIHFPQLTFQRAALFSRNNNFLGRGSDAHGDVGWSWRKETCPRV